MEVDQVAQVAPNSRPFVGELKFDSDRLKIFYERIFPFRMFFQWLSYSKMKNRGQGTLTSIDDKDVSSDYFYNREFSFTLANDVYCRYLCYKTAEDFKLNLVDRVPHKIDIGAVFNFAPSRHLTTSDKKAFVPMEKEMVFDIDMDAYDDVRTCCTGAQVCQKCWSYLNVAAKMITDMLKEDFDFTNCLWVFSGRRGVHCWICDPEARNMNNEMRTAVTQYFNIGTGNENSGKLTLNSPLHPALKKAYKFLEPFFEKIVIQEQNLLSDASHQAKFISYMPNDKRDELTRKWKSVREPCEMWEIWKNYYNDWRAQNRGKKFADNDISMETLVLCYLYPRLDANVSTSINHLLKSPFCVHPKTGNICVPFDPNNVENFKLSEVPTLTQVINELGSLPPSGVKSDHAELPCLEPFIQLFRKHIKACTLKQEKSQTIDDDDNGQMVQI